MIMFKENQTVISEFLLVGFQNLSDFRYLLFTIFFLIYVATITGNCLVIAVVSKSSQLHSPMYFFLQQLSLSEILFTTNIVPKLLSVIVNVLDVMSVPECIIQLIILSGLTKTECSLLTVMSYDRFLAICKPLHYASIMNRRCQLRLVWFSWLLGSSTTLTLIIQLGFLKFCSPATFDHYYCDPLPLLKHSCSDVSFLEIEVFVLAIPVTLFPFIFITVTYVCVLHAIFQIPSSTGRQKVFSTCSSHMAVVCIYYGTLVTLYVSPSLKNTQNAKKYLSLLYTIVTPLLNPIIYSIRNQEIRAALMKQMCSRMNTIGWKIPI